MTVHRCLQGKAPQYPVNCCHPTSDVASRQRLRSSSRHHLVVPRHRRSTLGRRAFSVAGPMAWNALPDDLRDPSLSADNFRKTLKTHLFRNTQSRANAATLRNLHHMCLGSGHSPLPVGRADCMCLRGRPCVWLPFSAACCYTLFYLLVMPAARLVCQRP